MGSGGLIGAMGLGGSVAFNPAMLKLGVPPRVTSATSQYITMFGAASRTFLFLAAGELDLPYSALLGVAGIISTILGLSLVKKLIDKYKRPSIIVIVLAIMLILSSILMPIFQGQALKLKTDKGISITKWGGFCRE